MHSKAFTTMVLAGALAAASCTSAFAAKHPRATKLSGACANQVGRCVSDCDSGNWCQMYACVGGKSTPVPFWRCFEPSGLCLAPHC